MNREIQKKIGKRIRSLRKVHNLTQKELAERAGISYKYVGEIERGEKNFSVSILYGLARGLGISMDRILEVLSPEGGESMKVREGNAVYKSNMDYNRLQGVIGKKRMKVINEALNILREIFEPE
ncbi:MAG: helix-turn-helix domain-containing protein [Nitrospirota bacterium]